MLILISLNSCDKNDDIQIDELIGTWGITKITKVDDGSIIEEFDSYNTDNQSTFNTDGTLTLNTGFTVLGTLTGTWVNLEQNLYSITIQNGSTQELNIEFLNANEKRIMFQRSVSENEEDINVYHYFIRIK